VVLLLAIVALVVYLFFRPKSNHGAMVDGPKYDLIFGVNTFDPNHKTAVTLAPYVIDGTLYLQVKRLPANEGTSSTWVTFYRYNSKTGIAEQLPSPSISEMQATEGKQDFVFSATKHIRLNTDAQSPDGYSLAEPDWVEVGPISNAFGNIALFLLSGKFGTITERESSPRLAKDSVSIAINSDRPILNNDADTAFLLGWIAPDSLLETSQEH
jgi:hypothetical protein